VRAEYGHGLFLADDSDDGPSFQWLHLRPGDAEHLILGNKAPLWYRAHWHEGRMQPCSGDGCHLCDMGIGRQRRWVFPVVMRHRKEAFLWEVSDRVADEIRGFAEQHGTITNLELFVRRSSGNSKGRIEVQCDGLDDRCQGESVVFPEPSECLELTWTALSVRSESSTRSAFDKSEY
jgi:hypothetical protein